MLTWLSVGATHASPLLLSAALRLGYYRQVLTEEEKKERIRYYADWARSLWIGVLALSGGLAGLGLAPDKPLRFLFQKNYDWLRDYRSDWNCSYRWSGELFGAADCQRRQSSVVCRHPAFLSST